MRRVFTTIALLGCVFCSVADAFAQAELAAKLAGLNQQIEQTNSEVEAAVVRQKTLEASLKEVVAQVSKLQSQELATEQQLRQNYAQKAALDIRVRESEQTARELEALSRKRLRTLYMYKESGIVGEVVQISDQALLLRNALFLSKVRARDTSIIAELAEARKHAEDERVALSEVVRAQEELKTSLALQREALSKRSAEQQSLITEIKREAAAKEKILLSVRAQVLRLETVLASLTNGGEPIERSSKKRKARATHAAAFASYAGRGLSSMKGRLAWPITAARISGRFGRTGSAGSPSRKGLEFSGPEGATVGAVSDGRVVFVGKMPEYGTVVILDHGQRYYSLYGRLSEVDASTGEELEKGDSIGKTAEPTASGANLYFEIRNAGIAVDPEPFFGKN
jgi:septal ring factor EnvC (AmiA/AmiB activator)